MQNESHSGIRFSIRHLLALIFFIAVAVAAVKYLLDVAERNRRQRAESRNLYELSQLHRAIESYRLQYGEVPPTSQRLAVIRHLQRAYPRVPDHESLLTERNRAVAQLDDAEILVLFLGGEVDKQLGGNGWPSFEFDPSRLIDRDSDGWLEYNARDGEVYRYQDGNATIHCKETDKMITVGQSFSER